MRLNTRAKTQVHNIKTYKMQWRHKNSRNFQGASGTLHVVSCIGHDQTPAGNFVGFTKHVFSLWFLDALAPFPCVFAFARRARRLCNV